MATPAKGKGRAKAKGAASAGQHPDYNVEYAKSGRAGCRGCEQKILKVSPLALSRSLSIFVDRLMRQGRDPGVEKVLRLGGRHEVRAAGPVAPRPVLQGASRRARVHRLGRNHRRIRQPLGRRSGHAQKRATRLRCVSLALFVETSFLGFHFGLGGNTDF